MSGTHSLFSPSAAARWSRCLGSLALCRDEKDQPSVYAAEGSAYHKVSEDALRNGGRCADYVGQVVEVDGFSFTIDAANAEHAQTYVDAIRRQIQFGSLAVEVWLNTAPILGIEGQGGTGDAVVLKGGTIGVNDLKFGMGEIVHAPDNEQLILYGAAALEQFNWYGDFEWVELTIYQPRVDHLSCVTYSAAEIRERTAKLRDAAQKAYGIYQRNDAAEIRANLTPGEKQCRWCPKRATCPARTEQIMSMFPTVPPESGLPPALALDLADEEVADALERVSHIEQWCADMRAEGLRRVLAGKQLPGWKMVTGRRGARKFDETKEPEVEAALVMSLGDAAYKPREIISPAQAEPLLKRKHRAQWDALQGAIVQADGKPTLAREIDPRSALAVSQVEFGVTAEPV